jgi:hypothetical protein
MRIHGRWFGIVTAAAGAAAAVAVGADAQEGLPLSACEAAVGAYLTMNRGKEGDATSFESRSLIALAGDGIALLDDSGQGGGQGFAPFTGGQGAWRCVSAAGGTLRISATLIDFTLATVDWPNQRIGRLDIDATVDAAAATISGTMTLFILPLDADPAEAGPPAPDAAGPFDGQRIKAP